MHGRPAPGAVLPLLTVLAGCARPTLSGDTSTDDGAGSSGSPPGTGTSSSGGGSNGGSSGGSSGGGSSGGSSSGGTDTGWTDTDAGVFIEEPDGGGTDIECDIFEQDCPEGEKCMPWANDGGNAWNATKCSPIDPNPKEVGEPCTVEGSGVSGVDDCKAGAMCWDVDPETNTGHCVAFCVGSWQSPTCENPCEYCPVYDDGILLICLPMCDPMGQDCPPNQGCYPVNEAFLCAPDASGPDDGAYKDPCEYINVCDPGLFCANAEVVPDCTESIGCCTPFCNLANGNSDCPDANQGVECVPWWEEEPPYPGCPAADVGGCVLP